jgi:signal transduction histidine kinase
VREFFVQNETIIAFAHGLVFFALGFSVWLQRRRATRLTLTSSLIWLAAFAFVEAIAIWGYAFVPIQETYLGQGAVDSLVVLRALAQTVAFLFLLQFGLRLVGLSPGLWRGLSAGSVALWAGLLAGGALAAGDLGWSVTEWESSVVAACRYGLLLPGALLSAYGMWLQREELTRAGFPGSRVYAAIAAGTLLVYAVVAGLVVDSAPWAPGGPVTQDGWFSATGIPLAIVRGVAGLVLCVAVVKLLEIFEAEAKQRLEAVERARTIAEERSRFGRDLHDGTIQSIYASGLHLEAVALRCDPAVRSEVREVVAGLNDTIDHLRDYIKGLSEPPQTPAAIAGALEDMVARFSHETGVGVRLRVRGVAVSGPLPDEAGQHLEQILREALGNCARHAGQCAVDAELTFGPDEVDLVVTDDGVGVGNADPASTGSGQGLRNMRERARRLGGRLELSRAPGGGTRVSLAVPLDVEAPDLDTHDPVPPLEEVTAP